VVKSNEVVQVHSLSLGTVETPTLGVGLRANTSRDLRPVLAMISQTSTHHQHISDIVVKITTLTSLHHVECPVRFTKDGHVLWCATLTD